MHLNLRELREVLTVIEMWNDLQQEDECKFLGLETRVHEVYVKRKRFEDGIDRVALLGEDNN